MFYLFILFSFFLVSPKNVVPWLMVYSWKICDFWHVLNILIDIYSPFINQQQRKMKKTKIKIKGSICIGKRVVPHNQFNPLKMTRMKALPCITTVRNKTAAWTSAFFRRRRRKIELNDFSISHLECSSRIIWILSCNLDRIPLGD